MWQRSRQHQYPPSPSSLLILQIIYWVLNHTIHLNSIKAPPLSPAVKIKTVTIEFPPLNDHPIAHTILSHHTPIQHQAFSGMRFDNSQNRILLT